MTFDDKYQAGEPYADTPKRPNPSFLEDPVQVATDILKDYAGARSEATLPELISLVKSLKSGGPADDRQGNSDVLIAILSSLPPTSHTRTQLTHKLIDNLWGDLQHPPLSYVGGDVKYKHAGEKLDSVDECHHKYDTIEFEVPDTGVTLREEVPRPPDGIFHYRMPDGSFNNILEPHLGRAGSPYAKSVRNSKRLHGVRPDAGQLFDLLMARGGDDFKENPAGISSMFFYHASIIIHDIFRTSRTDMNKSDTSSYLDLAPLYGSSLRDQLKIRTMKGGKLKPDTFHEKRLLGQPAGVNVLLVLYNRFHNYVCDVLLKINEGGRFTMKVSEEASPEDRAKAAAKQDHDLFNTARLIVVAMYVSISLGDYLRAIMNLHHTNTDWGMDPRVEIGKQYDGEGVPRGLGNQVSVEFNLLYRFHACISRKDERWINDFFTQLFPNRSAEDLENITLPELGQAMLNFDQSLPADPSKRTFDGLERLPNGKFKDEDLVRILDEAMKDPAGTFGARMVPKALKIIEVQGIHQARKWGCASLNEFRDFFGLKRYETFGEMNSDQYIAHVLEKMYTDPDMVELYPGLMVEEAKGVRNPGSGICPTYTVGRAILADAVTLVRGDRFMTLDYSVSNMTAWGINEVQKDPNTLGGSMLYRLIHRGLPGWFPFNSVAVMQPMYTKQANIEIAKKLGTIHHYSLEDPSPPRVPVLVTSAAGIKHVLSNPQSFAGAWDAILAQIFYDAPQDLSWFMICGDRSINQQHRQMMTEASSKIGDLQQPVLDLVDHVGAKILEKEAFELKKGLHQVDIIRDVAIPLYTQLVSDLFYLDLRTDENPDGTLGTAELYRSLINIRVFATNNTDPAESWNRRRRAADGANLIFSSTRKLVDEVRASRGLGLGISAALAKKTTRQVHHKEGSLRSWGFRLVDALLAQGSSVDNVVHQLWLTVFGSIGVVVSTFYEVLEFFLRPENKLHWDQVQNLAQSGDQAALEGYVAEAQRLTSTLKTARFPIQEAEVDGRKVNQRNILILDLANAARDLTSVSDPLKFNPQRQQPEITSYGYGQHHCFGRGISITFLARLLKLTADLRNLRPAPGQMGIVKSIQVGHDKIYLNDSWSYFAFYASTWKVQFDGRGKGTFAGDRNSSNGELEMHDWYRMLKKRKFGARE